MQPFDISTSVSSVLDNSVFAVTKSASIFTSDISFTMTATRLPSLLFKTRLSNVVFPAPKKPDKTVTGK